MIKIIIPSMEVEMGVIPEALTYGSFVVVRAEVTLEFVRGGGVPRGSRDVGTRDSKRPEQPDQGEAVCNKPPNSPTTVEKEIGSGDLSGQVEQAPKEEGDVEDSSTFHNGPEIKAEATNNEDGPYLSKNSGTRQQQVNGRQGNRKECIYASLPNNMNLADSTSRPELDIFWESSNEPLIRFEECQPEDEEPESQPPRSADSEVLLEMPPAANSVEEPVEEPLEQLQISEEPPHSSQISDDVAAVMKTMMINIVFKEESDAHLTRTGRKRACSVLMHNRAKRRCSSRAASCLPHSPTSQEEVQEDPTEALEVADVRPEDAALEQNEEDVQAAPVVEELAEVDRADEEMRFPDWELDSGDSQAPLDEVYQPPAADELVERSRSRSPLNRSPPRPVRRRRLVLIQRSRQNLAHVPESLIASIDLGEDEMVILNQLGLLRITLVDALRTFKLDLDDVLRVNRWRTTIGRIHNTATNYDAPLNMVKLRRMAIQIAEVFSQLDSQP